MPVALSLFNSTSVLMMQIDKKSHRSKDNLRELSEVLRNIKRSEFKDSYLTGYKVCIQLPNFSRKLWLSFIAVSTPVNFK